MSHSENFAGHQSVQEVFDAAWLGDMTTKVIFNVALEIEMICIFI